MAVHHYKKHPKRNVVWKGYFIAPVLANLLFESLPLRWRNAKLALRGFGLFSKFANSSRGQPDPALMKEVSENRQPFVIQKRHPP